MEPKAPPDEANSLNDSGFAAAREPRCSRKEVQVENPRAEKVAVVAEVRSRFEGAQAVLLTEYRGLNVAASGQLRRALRAAGGNYKIYKNTLVRFAARDLDLEIDDLLLGPTALAFVEGDAVDV